MCVFFWFERRRQIEKREKKFEVLNKPVQGGFRGRGVVGERKRGGSLSGGGDWKRNKPYCIVWHSHSHLHCPSSSLADGRGECCVRVCAFSPLEGENAHLRRWGSIRGSEGVGWEGMGLRVWCVCVCVCVFFSHFISFFPLALSFFLIVLVGSSVCVLLSNLGFWHTQRKKAQVVW